MTTIRTTCEHCGDVELSTTDIALELTGAGEPGSYRFVCPKCLGAQMRPATSRVVSILLATGVSYEISLALPPVTESDVVSFVALLEEDDWITHLTATS